VITLRDYQTGGIADVRAAIRAGHRRIVLVVPVGGGKTTMASEIIRLATERGRRCLFIAHRRELIDQAVARLARFGIVAGIIQAGRPRMEAPVQVASIDTLVNRENVPADIVIADECQHARAGRWTTTLARYPNAILLGLTATPFRLDGKGLGFIFDKIVAPVTVRELIRRGVILEPRVFGPDIAAELKGVHTVAGEFNQRELGERMNQRRLVGNIVEHWMEAAGPGSAGGVKRTIVFAVNVEHSQAIIERFREAGIAAEHVDAKTPNRKSIFERLARNETHVVSNVGIATEGWDLPDLGVVVLARPTQSLSLHIQMIGRGMRTAEGKTECLVLDHAGNHHRHGMVTDEIEYSLEDKPKKPSAPSVRQCPACYAIFQGPGACPACGTVPERDTTAPIEEVSGRLVEITPSVQREAWYASVVARVSAAGQRLGRARVAYQQKFGTWPRHYELERKIYQCPGHVEELTDHGKRCRNCYQKVVAEKITLPRKGSRIRDVLEAVYSGSFSARDISRTVDMALWLAMRHVFALRDAGFVACDVNGNLFVTPEWVDMVAAEIDEPKAEGAQESLGSSSAA
jgi:superfamily II DNA or RNA helicase